MGSFWCTNLKFFFYVMPEVFGCRKQGVSGTSEAFDSLSYWDVEANTC